MYKFIIAEQKNSVGIITLNSEKTLNALSKMMFEELLEVLLKWKDDQSIACIFFRGGGERAFCAGGDVRKLHDVIVSKTPEQRKVVAKECVDFFVHEYKTDYLIHRYPKPIVAWLDRIVMGGGVGVTNGASHRIATERSLFAMPEIAIGLYPDVGATWFLNRMPKGFGVFTAMTGARLSGADSLYLGLTNHFMNSSLRDDLLASLVNANWTNENAANSELVTSIIESLNSKEEEPASMAEAHKEFVSKFADAKDAIEFRDLLQSAPLNSEWISNCKKEFEAGAPSSAFVILEQLKRGRELGLADVFRSELNLSLQCTIHPDFAEGVRALLVDKDKSPKWNPPTLEKVTPDLVESFFKPLWKAEEHPFKDLEHILVTAKC